MIGALASGLMLALVAATPTIDRPVNDLTGLLEEPEIAAIEAQLRQHRKETGVQMAVLVVGSTGGRPIEWYSLDVATQWAGGQRGQDDGVLFTLAVRDRRMRLEVGYGLEPSIPDREARRIIDSIKPELRAEQYGLGVARVVAAVMERTRDIDPSTGKSRWRPPLGTAMPAAYLIVLLLGLALGAFGFRSGGTPIWVHALAWVVGPLVIAWMFREGLGFWFAYPFVFLWGIGLSAVGRWVQGSSGVGVEAWWILTALVALAGLFLGQDVAVYEGLDVVKLLGLHVGAQVGAIFVCLLAVLDSGGGGSYSGSSSSSSFSSSSSSSSSGGWSGGGGSFGGGGASSSW